MGNFQQVIFKIENLKKWRRVYTTPHSRHFASCLAAISQSSWLGTRPTQIQLNLIRTRKRGSLPRPAPAPSCPSRRPHVVFTSTTATTHVQLLWSCVDPVIDSGNPLLKRSAYDKNRCYSKRDFAALSKNAAYGYAFMHSYFFSVWHKLH